MNEAKKFLKAKGLKDTLYNVNYNPNQNRGLPEKEWIKNGLSALLDEYAEWKVKNISSNPVLADSKIYHRGKELLYETAKEVMDEFPEEDDYVQAHYQQFLRNGEHDDNTIDTSNYWNLCKKRVERGR